MGRAWASETVGLRNPHKQKAEFKAISTNFDSVMSITPSGKLAIAILDRDLLSFMYRWGY